MLVIMVLSGEALAVATPDEPSHSMSAHHHSVLRTPDQVQYSEFNHHTAGLAVVILGSLALTMEASLRKQSMLSALKWVWPTGWLLLGLFLFVRSDPTNWPLGPIGLVETFSDPETRQHKIFAFIVMAIGSLEGLRLADRLKGQWWIFLFPVIAIAAGLMLGLHSEAHAPTSRVYFHHSAGAVLGILIGVTRLLPDRGIVTNVWGHMIWPSLMILFGLQFMFYTEQ
jgi:putative copper resistance protein D